MLLPDSDTLNLISDDQVWLQRLKTKFFFSGEEAQYLKGKMQASYKQVYEFCENDTFELFGSMFNFDGADLRHEVLKLSIDFNSYKHVDYLVYFMNFEDRKPEQAIKMLCCKSSQQELLKVHGETSLKPIP